MHIAGGLYREICIHPAWNALLGSGGRAAQALAAIGSKTTLHSYFENDQSVSLDTYRDRGITLALHFRRAPIAFAYFHPLSTPHLEPRKIAQEISFHAKADTVLRFGFVEGDAVVSAKRAIFDPQGWRNPLHFSENGSHADEVALVLNAKELVSKTGNTDIEAAALELIMAGVATLVVVKRGVHGAIVVNGKQSTSIIPAFRSSQVFKIGTGDVFSALFAHYWGCERDDAATAAEQASLGVAHYAQYLDFPRVRLTRLNEPVGGAARGPVAVWASTDTLGRHYMLEETLHRLGELGIDGTHVRTTSLDQRFAAVLVLADGLSGDFIDAISDQIKASMPVVILDEAKHDDRVWKHPKVVIARDFTSALYQAAWAASG